MTNQNLNQNKIIPFTFNDCTVDVIATGNTRTDFGTGNTLLFFYLKNLRANFNAESPIPPAPSTLQNIVSALANDADFAEVQRGFLVALDMMLQPVAHSMQSMLDKFSLDDLLADMANIPTAE